MKSFLVTRGKIDVNKRKSSLSLAMIGKHIERMNHEVTVALIAEAEQFRLVRIIHWMYPL